MSLKQELKAMVEQALEEELTEHLAARSHERTAERRGYRNGYYRRWSHPLVWVHAAPGARMSYIPVAEHCRQSHVIVREEFR